MLTCLPQRSRPGDSNLLSSAQRTPLVGTASNPSRRGILGGRGGRQPPFPRRRRLVCTAAAPHAGRITGAQLGVHTVALEDEGQHNTAVYGHVRVIPISSPSSSPLRDSVLLLSSKPVVLDWFGWDGWIHREHEPPGLGLTHIFHG